MRSLFLTLGIAFVLVIMGFFAWFWFMPNSDTNSPEPSTSTNSNVYNNNSSTITNTGTAPASNRVGVAAISGPSVDVKDFKKDSRVVEDSNNAGHYHLAGGAGLAQVEAPFLVVYVDADQSFAVSIEQEPLSDTRLEAEQYLMQMLGIGQSDMCRLRYTVLVPHEVNEIFAGKNLGFSFCPGATPL